MLQLKINSLDFSKEKTLLYAHTCHLRFCSHRFRGKVFKSRSFFSLQSRFFILEMPRLVPIRLLALVAYFSTFSKYISEEVKVNGILNGAYESFFYDRAWYEYGLLRDPANAPVEKVASIINPEVTLPSGTVVKGKEYSKTRTFHNIQYAEPPVGDLR